MESHSRILSLLCLVYCAYAMNINEETVTEDPCQAENDEIREIAAQRDALYISTIVFASVGTVLVMMLSAAIYLISGREVKLREFAKVSLTDPFLTELEPEKKRKKPKKIDIESIKDGEEAADVNANEEGAVGGIDDVTSGGIDNKALVDDITSGGIDNKALV